MDVRTYRASSMQEALALVRQELGPEAAVLHTREVRAGGLLKWIRSQRVIEITASADVVVPSRLPVRAVPQPPAPPVTYDFQREAQVRFRENLKEQLDDLQSLVEDMCRRSPKENRRELPQTLFDLFTSLVNAEVSEELARELVERVRREWAPGELVDPMLARARVTRMIEDEIPVAGPIRVTPGQRRLVALVGPTGVGKTTTIAKLAANFRLRGKHRVGLITVDTYRIAAVEQLRTYADIIDLPMEVVSTPREMRQALQRLSDLDLILMDTAGRSPRDEVKIQELKAFLHEAQADEVHLVLSSVMGGAALERTAEKFATVGTTSLILTKLDELTAPGSLLPVLRSGRLPLSYLTNGQNVPDDIAPAEARKLARVVLGLDPTLDQRRMSWSGAA